MARPDTFSPRAHTRSRRRRWLTRASGAALAATLLSASALAAEAEPPAPLAPFEAHYRVSNGAIPVGTATFRLARESKVWRYRSLLRVEGVFALFVDGPLRETTWLELHEGELRPLAYRHQKGEEDVRVVFDWSDQVGRVSVRGDDDRQVELAPNTRDQSSAILAVMGALAAGERSVAFPGIDDEGEREQLRFEATGEERVTVPFGTFDAVRVERAHGRNRATVTWLAPELDWLPVQVEQRKDGELVARLALTRLDGEDAL